MIRLALLVALLGLPHKLLAADPVPPDHAAKMEASKKLFTSKVRGLLTTNCLQCHGGEKTKAGFSMATRELLLVGGDKGKAVLPGDARKSLLVKLITKQDEPYMPPKGELKKDAIDAIIEWIDLGAAYDKPLVEGVVGGKKPLEVTEKDKQYWAYRPLQPTSGKSIDDFITEKLRQNNLEMAPPAEKRVLLRRVYFDLIGLPPTPEQLDAFLNDSSPNAYEKVVDELLASPRYGERWGRHWLDPARYGESHGFEHDYYRPHAYHYRDFVIKALNADMPYDQFTKWQIAGDEFAPNDPLALAATGFLGAGVYPTQITNREAERIRYDAMDDMLATTGNTFLGMTIGCARCHDHKYDPFPTRDYYRMLSAFTTTVRAEVEVDLGTPAEKQAMAAFEAKHKPLIAELQRYEQNELIEELKKWLTARVEKKDAMPKVSDANTTKGLQALFEKKSEVTKLPKAQKEAVLKWFGTQDAGWKERSAKITEHLKLKPKETKVKIQATTEGQKPMRHHTADGSIPDFYPETFFLKRGDVDQKDGTATLGFMQVVSRKPDEHWISTKPPEAKSSYRRSSLANWLVDVESGAGALAARVMVNRLWHHHFGRGIVATVNDFGFQCDPPTHPQLLEWLAREFVISGWKIKRMHKLMVMSRVYQSSGTKTEHGMKLDPDNKLVWHRPQRRLEAEAIRDTALAVSGLLDTTMYGEGTTNENMTRRSIYFRVKRADLIPMLQVFDWPDTQTSCGVRPTTVVAPQALLFLNSPQMKQWADGFAKRLSSVKEPSDTVKQAYRIAFSREPSAKETDVGVAFLKSRSVRAYAQAILGLNELIYVD